MSLDPLVAMRDTRVMIVQPYHLYIERTDPTRNMARFYAMQISLSLFGDACLTRSWGRIGTSGRTMVHHFEREEEAVNVFLALTREKRARGYGPKIAAHSPIR